MNGEKWHGTSGGYTNHACRCNACTDAHRVRASEYRKRTGYGAAECEAFRELRRRYPNEFRVLFREARKRREETS